MYFGNTPGYVMAQSTASVPVANPVPAAGGVVPGQASYMYATSVAVPTGAVGGHTELVVSASPVRADSPTTKQSQHEKYIPLQQQV